MKILHNEIEMAHACNREWKCVQSFLSWEIWINSYFAHFVVHRISMDRCYLSAAGQDKVQLTWDQSMSQLLKKETSLPAHYGFQINAMKHD